MTLVEPVSDFIDALRRYFDAYGLTPQIDEVKCASIEEYKDKTTYDLVIAEGFIYTIGKPDYWAPLLLSFARKDGFVVTSYLEMTGSLIEILQAKVFRYYYQGQEMTRLLWQENFPKEMGQGSACPEI